MDDANLLLASGVLQESGVQHFLCHGTLLGLIREGDFIPWDNETDFSLFNLNQEERSRVETLLVKSGFLLESQSEQNVHFSRPGGRPVDLNYYRFDEAPTSSGRLAGAAVIEWEVPSGRPSLVYVWSKLGAALHRLETVQKPTHPISRALLGVMKLSPSLSKKMILSVRAIISRGVSSRKVRYEIPRELVAAKAHALPGGLVMIPHNAEAVLECLYGKEWRTPQKSIFWWGFAKST